MEPENSNNQPDLNLPKPAVPVGAVPAGGAAAAQPQTSISKPTSNGNPPGATPTVAEDSDLIEKEWVDKAKEIVEKNRNDPFTLNKEINQIKAEYIKKRYNKDIKLKNE